MVGHINNILYPQTNLDPKLAKVNHHEYTYGEDGHRGKRYKMQKAEEEERLMIPYYQKDGSCTVKSIHEYCQEHRFDEDQLSDDKDRNVTVDEVRGLIEDNMAQIRKRIGFHSVNDLI